MAKLSSLTRISFFVSLGNIFIVEGICVFTFRCKNMAMSTTIIDGCGAGDREKKGNRGSGVQLPATQKKRECGVQRTSERKPNNEILPSEQ